VGITLRSKPGRRGYYAGGYNCHSFECPICGPRNREEKAAKERRIAERRQLHGWRWLKHFLGIDQWIERRRAGTETK
jgi:hypothetical protein